jgi:hypothetical protein
MHTCHSTAAFRDEAEAHSRSGQFCSDLEKPRTKKVAALKESQKSRNPRFTRAKEEYEIQHERPDQGQLPRSEGNKGKSEKKAGKVQQRIGHAKEAVVNLKEQLSDLKKTG